MEEVQHELMLAAGKWKWLREMGRALEESQETSRYEFFHSSFTLSNPIYAQSIKTQVSWTVMSSQIHHLFDILTTTAWG